MRSKPDSPGRVAEADPVGAAEAKPLLAGLEKARGLGLAVSGGADSLALMHLAKAWRDKTAPGLKLVVLTVDHALRPESAEEARRVAAWADAAGLTARVLTRTGPLPAANLQEGAREARYALLVEASEQEGLSHILTAHMLDDQAETLMLRLARGSGLQGLACMPRESRRGGVRLVRPLLQLSKARLIATCRAVGQDWIEDPSNADARFARARMRRLMPALAAEGLSARRLAATATRLARAQAAIDAMAAELILKSATCGGGCVVIERQGLAEAPDEVALRTLARLLALVGGQARPPRMERLERALRTLRSEGCARCTLAGCIVDCQEERAILAREPARMGAAVMLAPGEACIWDGRFRVALGPGARREFRLGALGAKGWKHVEERAEIRVPAVARPGLAALFADERLAAVPAIGAILSGDVHALTCEDLVAAGLVG